MMRKDRKGSMLPIITAAVVLLLLGLMSACAGPAEDQKLPVQVLILPKFEVGEMEGDFPGEAQLFYEEYLAGGEEYEIAGNPGPVSLYYKDGVALCLAGQGKVNAALNTAAVLGDERFDFSDAYILSAGCGGTAEGYGIPGDVYVISQAVDFDLGHHADAREMDSERETTWFHDESFDGSAFIRMDADLTGRVFDRLKDTKLETTQGTVRYLNKEFPGQDWADRQPRVMRGTSVTADNYWKGSFDHQNALLITETYKCEDPYAVTEMEDVAVGQAVRQAGLLDRLIVLRVGVNLDVFPAGVTPEKLWGPRSDDQLASEDSTESIDIFETAMGNCFAAGRILIDAVLQGEQL